MKLSVIYPDEFFDFSNGVPVDTYEVQSWIDKAIEHLKEKIADGVKSPHATISSGNTLVMAIAFPEGDGKYTVRIAVSTAYKDYTRCFIDLS